MKIILNTKQGAVSIFDFEDRRLYVMRMLMTTKPKPDEVLILN